MNTSILVLLFFAKVTHAAFTIPTPGGAVGALLLPIDAIKYVTRNLQVIPTLTEPLVESVSAVASGYMRRGAAKGPELGRRASSLFGECVRFAAWRAMKGFRPMVKPRLGLVAGIGFDLVEGSLHPTDLDCVQRTDYEKEGQRRWF